VDYAGDTYQLLFLGTLIDNPLEGLRATEEKVPLLLLRTGNLRVALQVDGLIGRREIVVKSLGPQLSSVKGLLGATILGDGRVALILDITALVRKAASQMRTAAWQIAAPKAQERAVTVLVVDDSITIRQVTARLLERHHMHALTAKDGVDALEQLQNQVPDIAILDIEMPRMDGYELARHIRHTPEFKHIPIIMITSRIGEKHRDHALEIGVNRYLGKPYQETELLDHIHELLNGRC
jgi:chemosensory pili system protein ChpA (sensor histidine kinase/response regulator)